MTRIFQLIFFLFLFLPFYSFYPFLSEISEFNLGAWVGAFGAGSLQASVSAAGSVGFGFIGAFGLLKRRRRFLWEAYLLLPSFVPVLFVILSFLQVIERFPYGFWGIVLLHIAIHTGACSVILARVIESRLGGLVEAAEVMSVRPLVFIRRVLLRHLYWDIALIFLGVFILCFASFSVPSIVGRGWPTPEILIYETVIVEGEYSKALLVGGLQFFVLLAAGTLLGGSSPSSFESTKRTKYFGGSLGLLIPAGLTTAVIFGNLMGLGRGLLQIQSLSLGLEELVGPLFGSLAVGVGTGSLTLLMLALLGRIGPTRVFDRLILVFSYPSTALVGFGLLVLGDSRLSDHSGPMGITKLCLGLALLSFGGLYRFRWSGLLGSLKNQITVAKIMGASESLIFRRIVWPQVRVDAFWLAGLSGFWATGDFALSSFLLGEDRTLALVVESLMGSYRLEAATIIMWLSLIAGTIVFSTFWRLSRVDG